MAIGLQNYQKISAPDSDYPNGNIKDNPGDNSGTPFNTNTYQDIHQVFAKVLRLADITASGLPENEYSGFQYLEGMRTIFCDPGEYIGFNRSISLVVNALKNPLIEVLPGSPNSGDIAMAEATDHEYDSVCATIKNSSSHSVKVYAGGTDTINNTSFINVGAGNGAKICLDKTHSNWVLINVF
jgi:hypothetical protein